MEFKFVWYEGPDVVLAAPQSGVEVLEDGATPRQRSYSMNIQTFSDAEANNPCTA